jgi:hypothetical protein
MDHILHEFEYNSFPLTQEDHTRLSLRWEPWTRVPGHHNPGPWSQVIFLFLFFIFLAGVLFSKKNEKKHCFLSVFPLFLSLFLSFQGTHTLSSFEFNQFHQSKL